MKGNKPSPQPMSTKVYVVVIKALQRVLKCVYKLQWSLNQNTKLFIRENALENVVCEKMAILSRGDELMTRIIC